MKKKAMRREEEKVKMKEEDKNQEKNVGRGLYLSTIQEKFCS